jgi:signal transduction histidine kinase
MSDSKQSRSVSSDQIDQSILNFSAEDHFVREQLLLAELMRDISLALIQSASLQEMVQQCAEALVSHFDAAFARIWTLSADSQILELQASAGMYTHLNGSHSRVPIGTLKIGMIASERLPHLSNAVIGDPRVSEQEWARKEGMVAFAGYPLLVSDRLVGVMALFARHTLSHSVLGAMASIANTIAVGIDRKQGEQERLHLLFLEQQARAEAEEALAVRTRFLSSISHDLKTPLASIKANSQLMQRRVLRNHPPDETWLVERLRACEHATTKMVGMIDDLLELTRQQTGQRLDEVFQQLDLIPLLQQVVAEQRETTRRHRILVREDAVRLPVRANSTRLDRVFTNLLGNAIKYSPGGGEIMVTMECEEQDGTSWAVVSVIDKGVGIPPADLPYVFEPFHRAENVVHSIQGTGVGLSSAVQVLEQHGGSISVTSQQGEGSMFTVRLPLTEEVL